MDKIKLLADDLSLIQQPMSDKDLIRCVLDWLNLDYMLLLTTPKLWPNPQPLKISTACCSIVRNNLRCIISPPPRVPLLSSPPIIKVVVVVTEDEVVDPATHTMVVLVHLAGLYPPDLDHARTMTSELTRHLYVGFATRWVMVHLSVDNIIITLINQWYSYGIFGYKRPHWS